MPAGKFNPSAAATFVAASSAVMVVPAGAASITACTKVVSGLTVVEPAGAFRAKALTTPVSILTPPSAMMVPAGAELGKKKLPLASVTTPTSISEASATPSILVSI